MAGLTRDATASCSVDRCGTRRAVFFGDVWCWYELKGPWEYLELACTAAREEIPPWPLGIGVVDEEEQKEMEKDERLLLSFFMEAR